jgi:hypothetical protein
MASLAMLAFSLLACLWLGWFSIREHRRAMAARRRLLEEAGSILHDAKFTVAPDHFPRVAGMLADGTEVRLELCADTLVTRRLPQLWLRVTLIETEKRDLPTLGVLARPTGSEFYSLVHELPEWLAPPETGISLLMRGSAAAGNMEFDDLRLGMAALCADPMVKEVVVTPKTTRITVQAAQGERAAHLFLRQARFALETVPAAAIRQAVMQTQALRALAAQPTEAAKSRAA